MAALGIFNLLSGNLYLQRKTEVYRNLRVIQWYEENKFIVSVSNKCQVAKIFIIIRSFIFNLIVVLLIICK